MLAQQLSRRIKTIDMLKKTTIAAMLLSSSTTYAFLQGPTTVALSAGISQTHQGKAQNIAIDGLIGDRYTVTKDHDNGVTLGLGLFKQ